MSDLTLNEDLDDILEHYGIKGMKWGVRRSDAQLARARGKRKKSSTQVRVNKDRTEIDKVRIKGKPAPSEDAIDAEIANKKAKKGGVKTLSNQELQALNQRLNLEQQYSNLTKKQKSNGAKAMDSLLKELKAQQVRDAAQWASKKAVEQILK